MFSISIPILCHLNSKSFIEWALLSLPPFAASTLIMHSFWTFGSLELRRHISWMFVFRILRVLLRACLLFSVDVHYYLLGSKQLKFTKWWLFCMPAAIKLGCLWQQMHAIASCSHTNGKNIHMMITRYSYIGIRGSEAAPFDEGSKLTSFLKHREFLKFARLYKMNREKNRLNSVKSTVLHTKHYLPSSLYTHSSPMSIWMLFAHIREANIMTFL